MGIASDLKSEIKQDQILEKALKDLKKAYAQKTSTKQRTLFVKKKYKQHGNVDLPLVAFYKRAIKGLGKNTGDGTLWNDSAIVTGTVTFLQKHFETKVISAHHFTRLGEEMKLALINQELCVFLESKMESAAQMEETEASTNSPKKSTGDYTKKRQAVALFVLLKAFNLESDNQANVGRILHLLSAKPIPGEDKTGNVAWNRSDVYNARGEVVKGVYNDADLNFVENILSSLHHHDKRIRVTIFDSAFEELRKNLKVLSTRKSKTKKGE